MIRTDRLGHRTSLAILTTALAITVALGVTLRAQDSLTIFIKLFDRATGEPVTDVRPDEITILEDDEGRETVAVEPIDWPVKLHILVDNSARIRSSLERIRQGLRELVEALPEGMAVEIVSTAPQPRFAVRMTSDLAEAREGIDRIVPDSGASAFVDALVETSDRIRDDDDPYFLVVLMVAGNGTDPSGGVDRKLRRLQVQTIEQPVTNHFIIITLDGHMP